jgi:hypothetical protein
MFIRPKILHRKSNRTGIARRLTFARAGFAAEIGLTVLKSTG